MFQSKTYIVKGITVKRISWNTFEAYINGTFQRLYGNNVRDILRKFGEMIND